MRYGDTTIVVVVALGGGKRAGGGGVNTGLAHDGVVVGGAVLGVLAEGGLWVGCGVHG